MTDVYANAGAEFPARVEDATAAALLKHFACDTAVRSSLFHLTLDQYSKALFDAADNPDRQSMLSNSANLSAVFCMTVAFVRVLRELAAVDSDAADRAAQDVWSLWDAGDAMDDHAADWAREYGVDYGEVFNTVQRAASSERKERTDP